MHSNEIVQQINQQCYHVYLCMYVIFRNSCDCILISNNLQKESFDIFYRFLFTFDLRQTETVALNNSKRLLN